MNYNFTLCFENQKTLDAFNEMLDAIKSEISMSKLIDVNKLKLEIYSEALFKNALGDIENVDDIYQKIDEIADDCNVSITNISYSFDSEDELNEQCENHYGWITVTYFRAIRQEDMNEIDTIATAEILDAIDYLNSDVYTFEFSNMEDCKDNEIEYRVFKN